MQSGSLRYSNLLPYVCQIVSMPRTFRPFCSMNTGRNITGWIYTNFCAYTSNTKQERNFNCREHTSGNVRKIEVSAEIWERMYFPRDVQSKRVCVWKDVLLGTYPLFFEISVFFFWVDFPCVKLWLFLYSSLQSAFTFMNSFNGIGPGKSLSRWQTSAGYPYPPNVQIKFFDLWLLFAVMVSIIAWDKKNSKRQIYQPFGKQIISNQIIWKYKHFFANVLFIKIIKIYSMKMTDILLDIHSWEYTGCSLNIVFISEDFRTLTFLCFPCVSVCVHIPGR